MSTSKTGIKRLAEIRAALHEPKPGEFPLRREWCAAYDNWETRRHYQDACDLLSALDAAEAELHAARKVVEAARLVDECAGMTLLGGEEYDPGQAYRIGAGRAFDQCAGMVHEVLAEYDAAVNQPPKG